MNRFILEYTPNASHLQINKGQSNELEKIQKRNLSIIYGFEHSYEKLLEISGLKTLEERRGIAFEKFARKTVKKDKYSHWFQKNLPKELEDIQMFTWKKMRIFAMRRLLKRTPMVEQIDLTGLFKLL